MPKDKDLKRLIRSRMEKTGESYTTARARLLDASSPAQTEPSPEGYPELAGMSDEALEAETGRTWKGWVALLDAEEASGWPHRRIAEHVHERFEVPGWWAQTVTVGYERIKGLREIGQQRDGHFEANKSKTLPVPVERLYEACADEETRRRWLPGIDLAVRKATPTKSMRLSWPDGTPVEMYFWAKGDERSQVQVQHRRLPSREQRERMKGLWGERLEALGELLTG